MPRLCQARRTLPGADGRSTMVFTCTLPKDHSTERHIEDGRVRSRNGQVAIYTFAWQDEGRQLWRQEAATATGPEPVDDD